MPFTLLRKKGNIPSKYWKNVAEVNAFEPEMEKLSDEELRAKTAALKDRLNKGESPDHLRVEAFAVVREAAKRTLRQRHFDVQLIGGMALSDGKIAEMYTGEGKTLSATLPAYFNALFGEGVHIVTVNDYLARRDAVWMGQIYAALGLSVACLNHESSYIYDSQYAQEQEEKEHEDAQNITAELGTLGSFKVFYEFLRPISRKEAYQADIVYGTNNEYGFDYLKDNLIYDLREAVQRKNPDGTSLLSYVIVDEIDSILIDEARTPLIISAPFEDSTKLYQEFSRIAASLKREEDYTVDEKKRTIAITDAGMDKVEKTLNLSSMYAVENVRLLHHLEQAVRAEALFIRDKHYIVKDNEVVIVDEFTGRLMPGRRYSEGLHQALEAKEHVSVQQESKTLATITFQNYFRLYKKLSGMTGTASTSAEEFFKVYGLEVVSIPTNKPLIRQDEADRVYKNERAKFRAIVNEVKELHKTGRPVLVGTVSIEKNEYLSSLFKAAGVPHNILNAKNHEKEAEFIAQAGKSGAVTLATNMAGRGVDIVLGGKPTDPHQEKLVKEAGGLAVIGTERHEARRIDNQLRGRAGRQGDRGSSIFYVSLEDELMRVFGGDNLQNIMTRFNFPEDEPIRSRIVSKAIETAQTKIEGYNFDTRKYVLEYDEVIAKQREKIYAMRNAILEATQSEAGQEATEEDIEDIVNPLKKQVWDMVANQIYAIIESARAEHTEENKWIEQAITTINGMVGQEIMARTMAEDIVRDAAEKRENETESLALRCVNAALALYNKKEREQGFLFTRVMEKNLMLSIIDNVWTDHLDMLDYVKATVNIRAYGQHDPLVEYKNEAHKLFFDMMAFVEQQVANVIFKTTMAPSATVNLGAPTLLTNEPQITVHNPLLSAEKQRTNAAANTPAQRHIPHISRNDPCPCGSGKKYKKCGMINSPEHLERMAHSGVQSHIQRIGG